MQFSPETAVYPVHPPTAEPGRVTVDWTENQSLGSGWLLSRTRTQFLTIGHAEQRECVDFKPGKDGGLAIVNDLPWELEAVLVADASGRLLSARNVLPNASEVLADVSEADRSNFVQLLGRNRPELPDNFSAPDFQSACRWSPEAVRFDGGPSWVAFRFKPDGAAGSNVVPRPFGQKDMPLAALLFGGPPARIPGLIRVLDQQPNKQATTCCLATTDLTADDHDGIKRERWHACD